MKVLPEPDGATTDDRQWVLNVVGSLLAGLVTSMALPALLPAMVHGATFVVGISALIGVKLLRSRSFADATDRAELMLSTACWAAIGLAVVGFASTVSLSVWTPGYVVATFHAITVFEDAQRSNWTGSANRIHSAVYAGLIALCLVVVNAIVGALFVVSMMVALGPYRQNFLPLLRRR